MQVIRISVFLLLIHSPFCIGATPREEGLLAFKEGRYSVALAKLQAAVSNKPDPTVLAFLSMAQAALGDCKSAIPGLSKVPESVSATIQRMAGLAAVKCYSQAGNDVQAFALLERLKQKFPGDPDVLYLTAKLHMKAFNDATFAMFQRAPSSYRVHQLSAEIFEIENRFGEAVAEYRKAIEINPTATDLHFRLGRALLLQNHAPETLELAADAFRSELKLNPEDASCEFQLGQIAQVQSKPREARTHFERALSLSPSFVQALIGLGKLESSEKSYDNAIRLLGRAVAIQPQNETAHYALLTAYRNAGQMENARKEKETLDRLGKPPEGEFSNFLKKLGEKQPQQ
jgi:tetratricopeptide (TPR) repeat protein